MQIREPQEAPGRALSLPGWLAHNPGAREEWLGCIWNMRGHLSGVQDRREAGSEVMESYT